MSAQQGPGSLSPGSCAVICCLCRDQSRLHLRHAWYRSPSGPREGEWHLDRALPGKLDRKALLLRMAGPTREAHETSSPVQLIGHRRRPRHCTELPAQRQSDRAGTEERDASGGQSLISMVQQVTETPGRGARGLVLSPSVRPRAEPPCNAPAFPMGSVLSRFCGRARALRSPSSVRGPVVSEALEETAA